MELTRATNPYSAGAGTTPPYLAGRDADVERFDTLLARLEAGEQGRSLVYSGLRGVGKTVLLLELEKVAAGRGWDCTGVVEIGATTDFRTSIGRMTHRLLRGLSRKHAIQDRVLRALGVLKAFTVTAPGGFQLNIDVSAIGGSADSGDIEDDLTELLVEVGEAARAGGKGVVYLVDEMQNLEPVAMGALCMAFHKLAQRQLPVALVGAGLPPLPSQLRSAKPYAERLFEYFPLGRLSDAEARSALVTPATRKGASFADGAVELIVRAADGHPYFIQELGRVVWGEAGVSPITAASVAEALPVAQDILDEEFFDNRVEEATNEERRYMAAMADLGDGPQGTAEVTARAGYKKRASSGKARQALIRKGLVYAPEVGTVDFTVPHFAAFMRRRYPLAALLRSAGEPG
jgi:AAA ATPase-like protein